MNRKSRQMQILRIDATVTHDKHGVTNDIFEFTNISWPWITRQCTARRVGYFGVLKAKVVFIYFNEMQRQRENIADAFAQWR